jgi:hypothetical protein
VRSCATPWRCYVRKRNTREYASVTRVRCGRVVVQVVSPPPRSLGTHLLPYNTQCGETVQVEDNVRLASHPCLTPASFSLAFGLPTLTAPG